MAIGFLKGGRDEDALLADINTTPLVDVMLVLLIIFLITIPAVHTSVAVSLPRQANQVRETRPENVVVSVDATGATYWGDQRLPDARALPALPAEALFDDPRPIYGRAPDAKPMATP